MDSLKLSFHEVMYHCIIVYNEHGYYNKHNALIHDMIPTSKRVIESIKQNKIKKNTYEYETINYIIEWLLNVDKPNLTEYIIKAQNIVKNGINEMAEIGLVASLIIPYNKHCKQNK